MHEKRGGGKNTWRNTHAYIAVGLRFAMVCFFFSAFNFLETNFLKPCEVHKLAPVFKETRLFFTTQIQCCNLRSRLHLVDFVPSWQLFSRVTQIVWIVGCLSSGRIKQRKFEISPCAFCREDLGRSVRNMNQGSKLNCAWCMARWWLKLFGQVGAGCKKSSFSIRPHMCVQPMESKLLPARMQTITWSVVVQRGLEHVIFF